MATEQPNNEFVRHWTEIIWDQRDVDVIDEFVDEEFLRHDLSRPEPVRGPDGVREMIAMCIAASSTHEGEFMRIERTGEVMEVGVAVQQTERNSMRNSSMNVGRRVLRTGGSARTQSGVIA